MKLIKLLYLADRKALLDRGRPITGDRMVSMPKGPVLSGVLDLITWGKRRGASSVWFEYVSEPRDYDVTISDGMRDEDFDELSSSERRILDEIDARFGRIDKWSLVDLTHSLPEWRDPSGSSFPIDPADILRAAGRSEEEIQRVTDNAEESLLSDRLARLELQLDK